MSHTAPGWCFQHPHTLLCWESCCSHWGCPIEPRLHSYLGSVDSINNLPSFRGKKAGSTKGADEDEEDQCSPSTSGSGGSGSSSAAALVAGLGGSRVSNIFTHLRKVRKSKYKAHMPSSSDTAARYRCKPPIHKPGNNHQTWGSTGWRLPSHVPSVVVTIDRAMRLAPQAFDHQHLLPLLHRESRLLPLPCDLQIALHPLLVRHRYTDEKVRRGFCKLVKRGLCCLSLLSCDKHALPCRAPWR